jgi:hypothetical protein
MEVSVLEKLTVAQLTKKFHCFIEPTAKYHVKDHTPGPYFETVRHVSHRHNLFKKHFNIILLSRLQYLGFSYLFGVSD